jgi:hypothetical protein
LLLASGFVLSLTFLAIMLVVVLAVVLTFGGYLWWKTRDLRKEIRARMQPQPAGDIIEGEVIRTSEPGADRR